MPTYVNTKYETPVDSRLLSQYINKLIGRFYKILPLKESGEASLEKYMTSLLREMLGCCELIAELRFDDRYLSLLSILQYHIDNNADVTTVKSDVFKSISMLKQLQSKHEKE